MVADRVELSARARNFLTASIRRDRRRRGRAVTILSALLVVAVSLAAVAFDRERAAEDQQRAAEERQRLATARQLLAQAENRLDQDPRTALRLNEAAVYMHDSPETRAALVNNVLTTPLGAPLTGYDRPVTGVAFAPDGNTLASAAGSDGTVRLWNTSDPAAPKFLGSTPVGQGEVNWAVWAVAFAPDGSLLASAAGLTYAYGYGGEGNVRLWNTSDPAAPTPLGAPLTGHGSSVRAVAFASDGNTLASASDDGTVQLWNTSDPAASTPLGAPLTGHDGPVTAVAFAGDGNTLASAGSDGTVRLWDLTGLIELRGRAMDRACAITRGGLSRGEWESYIPHLEYVHVCKT